MSINSIIFSGSGVGQNCLPNTITCLAGAGITPFKNPLMDSISLKGYNLVIFPGGNSAKTLYIENAGIIKSALLDFINAGNGANGTCSGAYACANKVLNSDGSLDYMGWGLAPHVNAKVYAAEGPVTIEFTAEGTKVFGRTGTLSIDHENGPVFEVITPAVVLAVYVGGDFDGQPAIVQDGNVVLSGPHPELSGYCDMVVNMAKAATGGNNVTNTDISNTNDEIALASFQNMITRVNVYVTKNKKNPNIVFINSTETGNYVTFVKYQDMLSRYNAFYKANKRYPSQIAVNLPIPTPTIGSDVWVLQTIENKFGVTIKTKEDLYNLVIKEGVYAEYDNRKYSIIDAVNNYAWSSGINCADWVECIGNPVLRALGYRIGVDFWDIDGMVTCSDGTYGHYWITFNNSIPVQTWTASTNPNFFDLAGAAEEQRPQGTLICPEGECHIGDYQTDIPS
jgi:glutamine amidotransferase-like uncharacterized protein